MTPRFFPDGIAQPLPAHSNLVVQLHLHPSGKVEHERGRLDFFASPIVLPKGTRIDTEIVYDNSELNARNPHAPPKRVKWGLGTLDEMGSMTLLITTSTRQDDRILRQSVARRFREQLAAMFLRAR